MGSADNRLHNSSECCSADTMVHQMMILASEGGRLPYKKALWLARPHGERNFSIRLPKTLPWKDQIVSVFIITMFLQRKFKKNCWLYVWNYTITSFLHQLAKERLQRLSSPATIIESQHFRAQKKGNLYWYYKRTVLQNWFGQLYWIKLKYIWNWQNWQDMC